MVFFKLYFVENSPLLLQSQIVNFLKVRSIKYILAADKHILIFINIVYLQYSFLFDKEPIIKLQIYYLQIIKINKQSYFSMQAKQQQERFNKAVQLFAKKYSLTIISLFQFIDKKINSSDDLKSIIKTQILKYNKLQAQINVKQLPIFFHLIAAAQNSINIVNKDITSFHNQYKLSFVSSKQTDSKGNKEPIKAENKKVEAIDTKKQQKKVKQEQKLLNVNQKNKDNGVVQKKGVIINKKTQIKGAQLNIHKQQLEKYIHIDELKTEKKIINETQINYQNSNNLKGTLQNSSANKKVHNKKESLNQVKLTPIQQNINDSQLSQASYPSKTQEYLLNHPSVQMMKIQSSNYAQIVGYDKFGQNYLNPIIKFHIVYGQYSVYRRYSEFQSLMSDLSIRYQGHILPQLPPKEGIKSNLSYFRGIDEAFLNERQIKLQQMINFLLNSKMIRNDEILQSFLKEPNFEISNNTNNSTLSYLKSITTIAFNAKELKNYGMAYYNYIKQFKKQQIATEVVNKYKEIENLLNLCLKLDNHRNSINNNFQQRRQVFKQLKIDKKDRNLVITKFDKISATTASQIRNLGKQFNKYLQLKSQQSWLNYLIHEKQNEDQIETFELKQNKNDIMLRISKMEENLLISIEDIKQSKLQYLQGISQKIIQWRKSIHP